MTGPRDLFGNPLTLPKPGSPRETARLLYDEADSLPRGSAERADLYRRAAEAQRQADAGKALAEAAALRLGQQREMARRTARQQQARRGASPTKKRAPAARTAEAR